MNFAELHPEFGIQATDIDLSRSIRDAEWKKIELAMETHSVMLFRGQTLNDELQLGLTRRFGIAEEEHVSYYSRGEIAYLGTCLLYTSPSPRDATLSRMPSSA